MQESGNDQKEDEAEVLFLSGTVRQTLHGSGSAKRQIKASGQ
jgi:hypothetical protein